MGGGRGVEEFKEPMARFACHAGWIEAWGRLVFRGDTLEKRRLCIEWGWRVSSIISLRRQARIFIDYTSHPLKTASLIGKRTTVDEERKREREREKGRRGRDIWHGSTWLVSHLLTIFVLTVFVEGTYLYVGPWTYFLYTYSCIISVYTFPHSSAGEHYHCRNVPLLFFIFLVLSPHCSCNES